MAHRLKLSGQVGFGILAGQGVLIAIVIGRLGADLNASWFADLASAVALLTGMVVAFTAVLPRETVTIDPAQYQKLWEAEMQGEPAHPVAAALVEELLQGQQLDRTPAPVSLAGAVQTKYKRARYALFVTMIAVGLMIAGAALEAIVR